MEKINIGDRIKIIKMVGEPQYTHKEGIVIHIDDENQLHGTWGSLAIIPTIDKIKILEKH